jgi:hypothetical protein
LKIKLQSEIELKYDYKMQVESMEEQIEVQQYFFFVESMSSKFPGASLKGKCALARV